MTQSRAIARSCVAKAFSWRAATMHTSAASLGFSWSLPDAPATVGPPLLFAIRLWASVCLALFIAFWLELDSPYWAGGTAAIVCQPQLGASLRKGWLRMIGTEVIGGEKNARAICAIRSRQKRRGSFARRARSSNSKFVDDDRSSGEANALDDRRRLPGKADSPDHRSLQFLRVPEALRS